MSPAAVCLQHDYLHLSWSFGSPLSQCEWIHGAFEMSAYMRSPPLDVLIIPADAETPRMPKCRCLNLLWDIWPRPIAFGWEKFDATLKMLLSVPSLFFVEKEDVYPAPFLIPSSPRFLSCGTSILMDVCKHPSQHWKFWPVFYEHRSTCMQWGAHEHAAPMCLIHPRMAGPSFEHPYTFSLRKTLGWVVAISTSCRWQRSVITSKIQWRWQDSSCDNPDCHHSTKLLVGSHNKLESCKRGGLKGRAGREWRNEQQEEGQERMRRLQEQEELEGLATPSSSWSASRDGSQMTFETS